MTPTAASPKRLTPRQVAVPHRGRRPAPKWTATDFPCMSPEEYDLWASSNRAANRCRQEVLGQ